MISATIAILIVILLACALATRSARLREERRASLPAGKVLYSDTIQGKRPVETLVSLRYGLKGRPDYIVETAEGIVPVEIKSTIRPSSGRPYDSHLMQMICYCFLCEETMKWSVPYGIIRYRNGEVRVEYTSELRSQLPSLLEEMRIARTLPETHRSHSQAGRCMGCGFRDVCDKALG